MVATGEQVPVVALTGHLGAGKTTLLNRLLLEPGVRLGVVVNDFGAVNIDAALVEGQVGTVQSFAGGCLCHVQDESEFDDALEALSPPRLALDAIVVEASGLAEPLALARMIRYSGAEHVRPGGLVEVVDAVHYFETLDTGGAPPVRFAAATLVVLNKVDLLDDARREAELARIEARVREVNPSAYVVRTSRGHLDPALVLDVAQPEAPEGELPLAALLRDERLAEHSYEHDHVHASSVSVSSDQPVDADALVDLLESPPEGAYRLKGRVEVDLGRGRRIYVVHVVGRHRHVARASRGRAGCELVAIGLHLDDDGARARMEAVLRSGGRSTLRGVERLERLVRLSE